MGKFNFSPSKDQIEKRKEDENQVRSLQEQALEDAKRCLHSPEFKKLLEHYREAERASINVLLGLVREEYDEKLFGAKSREILRTLAHLKAMIDTVHKSAGEVYKDV